MDNCVTAELDGLAPEHIPFINGTIAGTTNVVIALIVGGTRQTGAGVLAILGLGAIGCGASITLWVKVHATSVPPAGNSSSRQRPSAASPSHGSCSAMRSPPTNSSRPG